MCSSDLRSASRSGSQVVAYDSGGNEGCLVGRKAVFAAGDATKGQAFEGVFLGKGKTRFITRSQLRFVGARQQPSHDRSHGVEHKAAGQVERRGELCLAAGLGMALSSHQLGAGLAKL